MKKKFAANGMPAFIGSLPVLDHSEALALSFEFSPFIPWWVQLPRLKEEGMIAQFADGLPGLSWKDNTPFVDAGTDHFNDDLVRFYEDYLEATEGKKDPSDSQFALSPVSSKGFFLFLERIQSLKPTPTAVKGQVTGPITFCMGVKDQTERAIFHDHQLRDAAVKLLGRKAAWQTKKLSKTGVPVIIFLDEPALAGFGSSEYIGISKEETVGALEEVIDAVHDAGGIAGVHVCANTDWSIILESNADIVNFDAWSYFDRFILYADQIKTFMASGGILAWGIVPTLRPEDIETQTAASLAANWKEKAGQIEKLGFDRAAILSASLITPSCGTGSLSVEHSRRVLELTNHVSKIIRADYI